MKRRKLTAVLLSGMCLFSWMMTGIAGAETLENMSESTEKVTEEVADALDQISMEKWLYNSDDDVYYQIGIAYCSQPVDLSYETLGIFVPGAYLNAEENGDGTYTCSINEEALAGNYTALTAPIVFPVETPGYSACVAPTAYQNVSEYTDAGFVYVSAGCRGSDQGAPAGVTDLKAAIRYIRYNDGVIPGDMDRIFSFGMSGGGAQSALLGATGDSDLYAPYLEAIGAVEGVSDTVAGSMCWCPITNLDTADEAYEWNMGVSRSELSDEQQQLSDDLAAAYADYINQAGLKDENGEMLTLEMSEDGIYQAGSYYEYLKNVIETSLNHFLEDTQFPYEAVSSGRMGGGMMGGMRGGFGGDGMRGGPGNGKHPGNFTEGDPGNGEFPGDVAQGGPGNGEHPEDFGNGEMPDGLEDGEMPDAEKMSENIVTEDPIGNMPEETSYEEIDQISRTETSGGVSVSGTYETAQDYIDALNANGAWVIYDEETNTTEITSIADFVKALKQASKNLGAFDQLDEGQGENILFGYGDGSGAHYDAIMAAILSDEHSEYADAYEEDLSKEDAMGNTVDVRLNMYTPLYYLLESYEGYQTSNVAKYWRIRTGINQGDTALSTEVNLALALESYNGVEDVDFETVWGQGHTQAERTGSSTDNFINWVNQCLSREATIS